MKLNTLALMGLSAAATLVAAAPSPNPYNHFSLEANKNAGQPANSNALQYKLHKKRQTVKACGAKRQQPSAEAQPAASTGVTAPVTSQQDASGAAPAGAVGSTSPASGATAPDAGAAAPASSGAGSSSGSAPVGGSSGSTTPATGSGSGSSPVGSVPVPASSAGSSGSSPAGAAPVPVASSGSSGSTSPSTGGATPQQPAPVASGTTGGSTGSTGNSGGIPVASGSSGPSGPLDTANFPPATAGQWWFANIKRQGAPAFGPSGYKLWRNVKDYGAKGDGSSDDTVAINNAMADGQRCGEGCDSTTTKPAIIYFPAGTYVVSKPLLPHYLTQIVGDVNQLPVIKASANFEGMAVIDADPYIYGGDKNGQNWHLNQNNFFRQIRNLVIDLTGIAKKNGAAIHWQVAQATSLQNIRFEMIKGDSEQTGVFIDNGSGGWMSDLTFNGGNNALFVGSQQFTSRNIQVNDCNTAVFQNWNWLWAWKSLKVTNCKVGIDMANSPQNQTVGSVLIQDSQFINTPIGVNSSFSANSVPKAGGTLIIDNTDFTGSKTAVQYYDGKSVLAGGSKIGSWVQGPVYTGSQAKRNVGDVAPAVKPKVLMNGDKVFERSKPQYDNWPASAFVSIKSAGAKGDGKTDDTAAIQKVFDSVKADQVVYFDHGAYIITDTVKIPGNKAIKVVGEIWPLIMASGAKFGDQAKPIPMFQVGQSGDKGAVEFQDLMFETQGPTPGAVLVQWNSDAASQGANAIWDCHWRIGGSAGTNLQVDKCKKNPTATHGPNPECIGAHTLFHLTKSASVYVENAWTWVADHELDIPGSTQIDIYNGRGVLIESQNPVWMYGTASEHNVLYQYQLSQAKNVYMSIIQTETPYFQSNPPAPAPFTAALPTDPKFGGSPLDSKAWGLRIVDSSDYILWGGGLYSFFENYGQVCVNEQNCQNHMISIEGTVNNINLFGVSTKASVEMVSTTGYTAGGQTVSKVSVFDLDNRSNFCATIGLWRPV